MLRRGQSSFEAKILTEAFPTDLATIQWAYDGRLTLADRLQRQNKMENSSAFVSVSLPAATTGWLPRKTSLVGGTLRWSECDYFQRQVSQRILLNGGITPGECQLRVDGLDGSRNVRRRFSRELR